MNDENLGNNFKKLFDGWRWKLLALLATIGAPLISYFGLQTVSKPYYVCGKKFPVGADFYQTVFVVNPGPWKTRHPEVEFSLQAGTQIVDYSPGVTVENKLNKIIASEDDGLPAGCSYFITYKYSSSITADTSPKVVCEGKSCKDSPTFDMDLMLLSLVLIGLGCTAASVVAIGAYIGARHELKTERESTVNTALNALLERMTGIEDVNESRRAVQELTRVAEKRGRKGNKKENGGKKSVKPEPGGP